MEEARREKIAMYDVSERVHYDHGRVRWESVGHVRWKGGRITKRGGRNVYGKRKVRKRHPLILGVDRVSGQATTPAMAPGGFASFGGGFAGSFSMARFDGGLDGAFDDGFDGDTLFDGDDDDGEGSFDEGGVDILDVVETPVAVLFPERMRAKEREFVYKLERGR